MYKEINIEQYLNGGQKVPLIDVRSPKEYDHAHIPGAVNLPLFTDEERAQIGITYKKEGRDAAVLLGLEVVSPKITEFVRFVREDLTHHNARMNVLLHCWRGGMRSKSMATLFDFAGIKTSVIKGGYKSYRSATRKLFSGKWNILIVGGRTGSAKTKLLHALKAKGEQIIDLEQLANHKGSAFGDLGEDPQPTTEMFENLLGDELRKSDPEKRIWIEDESHLIGTVFIPEEFWLQMRESPVIYCDFPLEERIQYLVNTYGHFDKEDVVHAVKKITKRLGGQHAKAALECFEAGDLAAATRIVLVYYDKTYDYGLSTRPQELLHKIQFEKINPEENVAAILHAANQINSKAQII